MTVYSMGRLTDENKVSGEEKTSVIPENPPKSIESHHAYKHGYFTKFRSEWSEADVSIVQSLANGKRIKDISHSLGLRDKSFHDVLAILRKSRKAKTNSELVAIALREGLIK